MSHTVSNKCLNNFETNRDQDLGKAIAEAASTLSNEFGGDKKKKVQLNALLALQEKEKQQKSDTQQ